jgi:predicted nucleotidyltransferase
MGDSLRDKANSIASAIKVAMNPNSILLFGSAARGTDTSESDLDICLLFEHLPYRKLEILRNARKIARPIYQGPMDFIAYSQEEWLEYLAANASFEVQVQRDAIAL